ncbi:SpoIIE family protein phosphatase [Methanoregula sp. PtaB.Bin085]|uniref:SpoIIE family protein phosphatase n=1 Tax=Methanoregula sp. PtaB.Bin085 TaxID=1811680 RepID=UPI0009CF141F|nr:SpoIIE family protein phosphatase [Methanoregula sp. PtaB.Bin085]OPX64439.1 MAG: nitrate/nitrite sensor protein NarX [Methanoregula sp. PtaB.Bin085]
MVFPVRLNVRAKILLLFLCLSVISLLVTGFVAVSTITGIGNLAGESSVTLGREAVNDSSAALMQSAEQNLLRLASDQASVTNVVFSDTEAELGILAANAAELQRDPPGIIPAPWYVNEKSRPVPPSASPVIFIAGTTVSPETEEYTALAGMAHLLNTVRESDPDLASIYIASSSGVMWRYPATGKTPAEYDPRTRDWYLNAVAARGRPVWSEPYVDAAGNGLVVTCSRAVTGRYGTWVIGTDVTIESINTNILDIMLNGTGYPVLLDSRGNVISRPGLSANGTQWNETYMQDDVFSSANPALVGVAANMTAGKKGIERVTFGNDLYYVAYAPVPSLNWSFGVSMPVKEILAPVAKTETAIVLETNRTSARIAEQTGQVLTVFAALFCLLLAIVVFLSWRLARVITRPVDALKAGAVAIGSGDLGYRVDLKTGDEFEDLAVSFNTMAKELMTSIDNLRRTTAEKERYTKELEIAKEIQDTFLPESAPAIPGIGIAAATIPAMEIGGDFYDFIPAGNGRWGIVMADVSGKGISAALFMALSRTLLHVSGGAVPDPSAAIRQANRWIYEDGRSSMFVTVFFGILDSGAMRFSYVNAGHNPPMLVRDDRVEELCRSRGIALGVVPDVSIATTTLDLRHGDILVLYTDGVTEAFNEKDEAFGEERLREFLRENRAKPARALLDTLVAEIRSFTGTAPQSDDITLVVVKVK